MSNRFSVLTWNFNRRKAAMLEPLAALPHPPDIVTLQEVTSAQADSICKRLHDLGYSSVYSGNAEAKEKRYGNVIAARTPIGNLETTAVYPWPQLVAHVVLDTQSGPINVITVHVPNGSGNGWKKIDTLEALKQVVVGVKGEPLILTGDFNEPRWVAPQNGRIVTWGQEERDGHWVPWSTWTFEGISGSGERWDAAVRWFFEGWDESGNRNAYWDAAGNGSMQASHLSHGAQRWFDHIFVSDSFGVITCDYMHLFREKRFSDHSAVLATLSYALVT